MKIGQPLLLLESPERDAPSSTDPDEGPMHDDVLEDAPIPDAVQGQRLRLYFSPERPKAITRDAWTALKKKYKTWRDEHFGRLASALADLLLADLAAYPPPGVEQGHAVPSRALPTTFRPRSIRRRASTSRKKKHVASSRRSSGTTPCRLNTSSSIAV